MPARDIYHQLVIRALEKAGWRITHDPYRIVVGQKNLFVDLGAEQVIATEREGKRIAVEVKSFG
jgi:XisH protein